MKTRFILAAALTAALASPLQAGEKNMQQEETFTDWLFTFSRTKEVKAVDNELYTEECGSCHFAYPPGLLPTASWEKLLAPDALEDHFGENAELDADVLSAIQQYVYPHAAEKSWHKRSRKIANATAGGEAPIRITEVKYIKRKHHEIPKRMIKGNPDVQSLSNCNACHTKAEKGTFDNDTVNIPNFSEWEDDD